MRQRRTRSRIALFAVPLATALVIGLGALRAPTHAPEDAVTMSADLSTRKLTVVRGGEVIKEYDVAVGKPQYPTPRGTFNVKKIVWNPKWVPPDSKWARGKKPAAPGSPRNPMKLVKIFFQEPDYYIHGSDELVSLEALPADLAVDRAAGPVSFSGPVRYGDLADALGGGGLARPNLARFPLSR